MITERQCGNKKSAYGEFLIDGISKKLTEKFRAYEKILFMLSNCDINNVAIELDTLFRTY